VTKLLPVCRADVDHDRCRPFSLLNALSLLLLVFLRRVRGWGGQVPRHPDLAYVCSLPVHGHSFRSVLEQLSFSTRCLRLPGRVQRACRRKSRCTTRALLLGYRRRSDGRQTASARSPARACRFRRVQACRADRSRSQGRRCRSRRSRRSRRSGSGTPAVHRKELEQLVDSSAEVQGSSNR